MCRNVSVKLCKIFLNFLGKFNKKKRKQNEMIYFLTVPKL